VKVGNVASQQGFEIHGPREQESNSEEKVDAVAPPATKTRGRQKKANTEAETEAAEPTATKAAEPTATEAAAGKKKQARSKRK